MTLLQSENTNALLNWVIAALIALVIISAIWVVSLYNHLVNLSHSVAEMKSDIQTIQTANAELKEQIFAATASDKLQTLATSEGLVEDKNPKYFPVDGEWSLASRF